MNIQLVAASSEDWFSIENMMQFYNYDLSEYYPIQFASSGKYSLASKQDYWAKPGVFPFLIKADDELAGFAVIDDEDLAPNTDFSMGYFFISRRFRNLGIGRMVAHQLFSRFPGRWQVYYLRHNKMAAHFWPSAISTAGVSGLQRSSQIIHGEDCVLFQFATAGFEQP